MTPAVAPDRRKRAILVNRLFYPDQSATAQILSDLAVHLASNGWDITVVTSRVESGKTKPLPTRGSWSNIDIIRVRSTNFGRGSTLRRLVDFISFYPVSFIALLGIVRKGDVLVVKTDPPLISLVGVLVGKLRGTRTVNWLQDLYPEVAEELSEPLGIVPISTLRRLRNWSLREASCNVAIGAVMSQRILQLGINADQIAVIPNWADDQAIRPLSSRSSSSRSRWGYKLDDFVLGYSGNLGRAHEGETLILAAQALQSRQDIHFLMVGGGIEFDKLRAAAERLALTRVRFEPAQPRDELADSLAAADAHWLSLRPQLEGLVVPSKFYGILAAGRPVIAVSAPDGEIGSKVVQLGCGMCVAPGDGPSLTAAIIALADDRVLCQQLGQRARAAVEGPVSQQASLQKWETLLTTLAA